MSNILRRQQVEKDLPPAPQTLLRHSFQRVLDAGIRVDQEEFVFIMRSCMDYFTNTMDGKKVMLKVLNADTVPGNYQKSYFAANERGDKGQELVYSRAVEFKGWIYNGRAVPHSAIVVQDTPSLADCDNCQGMRPKHYCVQDVRDPVRDRLVTMCNHCRLYFDHPKVKDTASAKTCDDCTMFNCPYNPRREQYRRHMAQVEHKPLIQLARTT